MVKDRPIFFLVVSKIKLPDYKLFQVLKFSTAEYQYIWMLMQNSVHFQALRRALRALFTEEDHNDRKHI